jgi:2'-5' RNA ligase
MPSWFAAIPVALPDGLLESWRQNAPEGLRWFTGQDCHLTICFFGEQREERRDAILRVLSEMPVPGFQSTVRGVRLLPHERRYSALSLELEDPDGRIAAYVREWSPRLAEAAGVAADTRDPLPHVTFARPDRRIRFDQRRKITNWALQLELPGEPLRLLGLALYGRAEDNAGSLFRMLWKR